MKRKRRKFTKEFKEETVKLVFDESYPTSEVSRNLDIHANLLGRRKREYEDDGRESSVGIKAELNRLRKENKRLKMECEILKKVAAFFGVSFLANLRKNLALRSFPANLPEISGSFLFLFCCNTRKRQKRRCLCLKQY